MRTSKILKRGISLLSLIALFLVGEILLTYMLEPVSYAVYFNHDVETLEKENAEVDLVIVGASRTVRAFVPKVFEETLGIENAVNAATVIQSLSGSYHQLKEQIERFDPQYVVLGLAGDGLYTNYNLQSELLVLDRLHGVNKLMYTMDVIDFEDWPYAFLKSYRFKTNYSERKIRDNINDKIEVVERGYRDDPEQNSYYEDKGLIYGRNSYEPGNVEISGGLTKIRDFNPIRVEYLEKIVELCKRTDTKLFLVTAPTTMSRVFNGKEYQYYHDWYANYAKENGLVYHNLNFLRTREDILPDSRMFDVNHVSGEGAYAVSEVYAEILEKTLKGENTDHYFYSTREELMMDVDRIVAVKADIELNDTIVEIKVNSLHNDAIVPSYQVLVSCDDAEYAVMVDWTNETSFAVEIPECNKYTIMVRAKAGVTGETEAFQCYALNKKFEFERIESNT